MKRRDQPGPSEPGAEEVRQEGGAGEQYGAVAQSGEHVEQIHAQSVHSA